MALSGASVLKDGTVSTTGGTATSLVTLGSDFTKHSLQIDDGSEFIGMSVVDFLITLPRVQAGTPNGYTQARNQSILKVPLLLDNGNVTVCTLDQKLSVDHEMTDAEIQSMLVYGAQFLIDSDFSDFWKKQSRA